jgi:hypothetical protein
MGGWVPMGNFGLIDLLTQAAGVGSILTNALTGMNE